MPSRDKTRLAVERIVRAVAIASLGALLWRVWEPRAAGAPPMRTPAGSASLDTLMARATVHGAPSLAFRLDSVPAAPMRGWLAALRAAGSNVQWTAAPELQPIAGATETLVQPSPHLRFSVYAPRGATASIGDAASSIDSASLGAGGVRVVEGMFTGDLAAHARGMVATARSDDSVVVMPVLVLARAGWEGKFTVAALEEAGWSVDARLSVTPGAAVEQGSLGALDTARYSAVVALDASAAPYAAAIAQFVRMGGGAVVGAGGVRVPAFASFLPASAGDSLPAALGALTSSAPRRGLVVTTLRPRAPSAVVIERRNGVPTIVAARVALGRVIASGYSESWRWRMMGGDGRDGGQGGQGGQGAQAGDEAHRAWWSALVSSVAYAPRVPATPRADASDIGAKEAPSATEGRTATTASAHNDTSSDATRAETSAVRSTPSNASSPTSPPSPIRQLQLPDGAPYASLVAALGPPSPLTGAAASVPKSAWDAILFALTLVALLTEWLSRRARGAR